MSQHPLLVTKTVRTRDFILPYVQANKLAGHCSIDAGRRQSPGSETKDVISHETASRMSISVSVSVPLAPQASHDAAGLCLHMYWVVSQLRNIELGEFAVIQ